MKGAGNVNYADGAVKELDQIVHRYRNRSIFLLENMFKGEMLVLSLLAQNDGVSMPSALAQAMLSSTARIAAILGALEQKGQITREIDKNDRRKIVVMLTQVGKERLRVNWEYILKAKCEVFERMGERDTVEFVRLLNRFLDIADNYIENSAASDERPMAERENGT